MDTDKLITQINVAKAAANYEIVNASREEAISSHLTQVANKLKEDIDKKFEEAKSAMLRANHALDCIGRSFCEFKSLSKPTQPIQNVAKAILILRGDDSDFTWSKGLKMLANPIKFIEELREFNKEEIDERILEKLKPILSEPYFNVEYLKSQNVFASILCAWMVNVVEYNRIYKQVELLIFEKEAAELEAANKEKELVFVRAIAKETKETLERLENQLRVEILNKIRVEKDASECLKNLNGQD